MGHQRYIAFISYSHADRRGADALLRRLQSYRLPKGATPQDSRRLGRFFMDRETLPASGDLTDTIKAELQQSENLIVVCSPSAVRSRWVNQEIETFRRLNPEGPVIAVILEGDPSARDGDAVCFPSALLDLQHDPLAADLRKKGDGPALGFLKVAAALSGAQLSALLQRDSVRQRRRLVFGIALSSAIALAMTGLAVLAMQARQEADVRRAEAEDLVDFMLGDLRDRLEPVGRIDVLDGVAAKTLTYYAKQDADALGCESTRRKARALQLQAELSYDAHAFSRLGESAHEAFETTSGNLVRCAASAGARFDHGQSAYWAGLYGYVSDQADDTLKYWTLYKTISSDLVSEEPDNISFKKELADASNSVGVYRSWAGEHTEALSEFQKAISLYDGLVSQIPANDHALRQAVSRNQIDTLGWTARTHYYLGDETTARDIRLKEIERSRAAIAVRKIEKPNDPDWTLQFTLFSSLRNLSRLEYLAQNFKASEEYARESVEGFRHLAQSDEQNAEWLNGLIRAQAMLIAAQRAQGSAPLSLQAAAELRHSLGLLGEAGDLAPDSLELTEQYWINSLELGAPG